MVVVSASRDIEGCRRERGGEVVFAGSADGAGGCFVDDVIVLDRQVSDR